MTRVACLGECMVELREQAPGHWRQAFAGDTYNTAVYLKRVAGPGLQVDFATGLGDDAFATEMAAAWATEGVGDALARRIGGRGTGLYTVRTDASGERRFDYWRAHSAARAYFGDTPTPLEQAADSIDLLYLSGISLAVMPDALGRIVALAGALRRRGARVAFDNNYRPRLWTGPDAARAAFAEIAAVADIALVTLDDQLALEPSGDEAGALAAALAWPAAEVVVKRGSRPAVVRAGGAPFEVAAERVAAVVDTTAAGDSFAAGYLARRLAGATPAAAAAFAHRLAAVVIGHPGAIAPPAATAAFADSNQTTDSDRSNV